MKSFLFTISLFTSSFLLSQTKEETINWINSKGQILPFYQEKWSDGQIHQTSTRYLKINSDASFSIHCKVYKSDNLTIDIPNYTFNVFGSFKDISSNSVTTKIDKDVLLIYGSCYSGECFRQISEDGKMSFNNWALIGVFDISKDSSLVERFKKAYLHLITLCGGKREAF